MEAQAMQPQRPLLARDTGTNTHEPAGGASRGPAGDKGVRSPEPCKRVLGYGTTHGERPLPAAGRGVGLLCAGQFDGEVAMDGLGGTAAIGKGGDH